jgi:hypothetical protein
MAFPEYVMIFTTTLGDVYAVVTQGKLRVWDIGQLIMTEYTSDDISVESFRAFVTTLEDANTYGDLRSIPTTMSYESSTMMIKDYLKLKIAFEGSDKRSVSVNPLENKNVSFC